MPDIPDLIKRLRGQHDTLSDEAADALQGLIDVPEELEIIGSWLVERNAHEPEYVDHYLVPHSDAQPWVDLATVPGWNPAPEGMTDEYRCTGPDGETPRPLPTQDAARQHARMGCGEIQKRHVTPWQKEDLTNGR